MKKSIFRIGKKSLSVIIALIMVFSMTLVGVVNVNAAENARVYLRNNGNAPWADPYMHYWIDGGSSSTWPGVQMTLLSGDVYYLDIPTDAQKFIFSSNGGNQTADLTLPSGWATTEQIYDKNTGTWSVYSEGGETSSPVYKLHGNYNGVYSWDTPVGSATTATEVTADGTYKFEITSAGTGSNANGNAWFRVFADSVEYTTASGVDTSVADTSSESPLSSSIGANGAFFFTPVSGQTYYVCVKATSDTDPTPLVWLESGSVTPIEKSYYIGGRFRAKNAQGEYVYSYTDENNYAWNESSTVFELTDDDGDGIYTFNTNSSIAELSARLENQYGVSYDPYFMIHTGNGINSDWYGKGGGVFSETSTSYTLDKQAAGTTTNEQSNLLKFSGSSDSAPVVLKFNPTTLELSYEIGGSQGTTGQYTITDNSVSGTVSLTAKADGKTENTADAEDTVTVTAVPSKDFFVCTGIKVEADDGSEITANGSGNTYTFTMPAQNVTITASYAYNKAAYITSAGDGLWVDVNPASNDTVSTLIKWNNYYGAKHAATNPYTFYLPKNAPLNGATVYNGYDSVVTVAGTQIQPNSSASVNLVIGDNTVSGAYNGNLKVMQGSTDAMFLYTTDGKGTEYPLPTADMYTDPRATGTKDDVKAKGGDCVTMDNSSSGEFSEAMLLEQIKGRGNSSWEASQQLFGKYAYNMKLDSKTNLLGMDTAESSGAKSWCLLANNADESMLRNTLTFDLANALGLPYTPEYRFVDIYDNGEYMGQYLITEKVDVGSSKLIKGEAFDDINEDAVGEVNETTVGGTYSYGGQTYQMQYANVSADGNTSTIPYDNTGTYLLEFEIVDRYTAEASWFISPKGQHVVVKSPEFATKEQVEYIAQKYAEMEAMVYGDSYTLDELSAKMDVDSFAKVYLVQEISSNLDSAATSYYVMYDCSASAPKFVASPVWDYDWAYGQYTHENGYGVTKYEANSNTPLVSDNPEVWYAKNKSIDNSETPYTDYNLQSKLANNYEFQKVIKKTWNGTSSQEGCYELIQTYYSDGGKIDNWYNQISASVQMNETRWGFIASNPMLTWGSKDTGATHSDAVNYLKNTWTKTRAQWLDTQFASYPDYDLVTAPTITAADSQGSALPPSVEEGTTIVITATSTDTVDTYQLFDGETMVEENATGRFEITDAAVGMHTYTVKAVVDGAVSEASNAISVTVTEKAPSFTVSLKSDYSSVIAGDQFTLTATVSPSAGAYTYEYFVSTSSDGSGAQSLGAASDKNTLTVTSESQGTYYYYVVVSLDGEMISSNIVSVSVTASVGVHEVTIYFKAPSALSYAPYISLNGEAPVAMTKDLYLGQDYSGSLKMYQFKATLTIDSSKQNTLTFTTKKTSVNASITDRFSLDTYYLAVDNLMTGTEVVDLTSQPEYIRNFYYTAIHMVYTADKPTDKTLGFTNIDGVRYKMGSYITENGVENMSIKSATEAQMIQVSMSNASDLQYALLDVNLDGVVDVRDATLIQKALISN